ncbi:MAG: hypothetical protein PWP37_1268 [Thermotogota bacterium]|nr:hypothetical protein [Thermotogota bacterium]MDK2865076.1 hypothetical protein [Thermotogota bacterium]HCZ07171.1 hypothetical protein [Thermotogota bacterium]
MKCITMFLFIILAVFLGSWQLIYVDDSLVATPLKWLEEWTNVPLKLEGFIPVIVCDDALEFSELTHFQGWIAGTLVNGVPVIQNRRFLESRGMWYQVLVHEILHYKLRKLNLEPCIEEGLVLLCEELFFGKPSTLRLSSWYNFTEYGLWQSKCLEYVRKIFREGEESVPKAISAP